MTEAWCVRCSKKTEILEPENVKTKNNRNAVKGKCSCGTKVMCFVKG